MRVVSLLPAATEIVAALGAGSLLVGVSHECDYPPEVRGLPRVTRSRLDATRSSGEIDRAVAHAKQSGVSPVELDIDLVARLRPDVIIAQSVCAVCAVGEGELERLVDSLMPTPWVVTLHTHRLDGVLDDMRRLGGALELPDEAEEVVAGLRYRLRRVRETRAPHPTPPRVLVLEWLDPPYVAGHWVPELVEVAGGVAVAGAVGEASRTHAWRDLVALEPDLVVIALCGFDVPRARVEFAAITDGDARALFRRRCEFLDGHAYTSRPGPRLVDAAEMLAEWLRG
ncbi:MAG TPA: ABC transporter substrate-binding protein [Gemmatimonadales bacterium]|nr:ABC transporter substrate-binding protein [Gemmatimonadales bacterium]